MKNRYLIKGVQKQKKRSIGPLQLREMRRWDYTRECLFCDFTPILHDLQTGYIPNKQNMVRESSIFTL